MAETTVQPPAPKAMGRPTPPRRPKRSFLKRIGYAIQMRVRQMFSRDALVSTSKSLPWVVLMTVLIWVYAEREQTAKQSLNFHIEARNGDPNRIVELSVPSLDGLHAELSGPQARLEQVREKLQSSGLQIDVPPELDPGTHTLDLSAVANNELFVKNGITVTNISPARIDVRIDIVDHRPVDVRVPPTVTNLDGPATFDPPRVIISGPKSVLDAASARGSLIVYAKLDDLMEPGFKSLPSVPVYLLPRDPRVTISPATVSARVTVKNSEVEDDLLGVPVWVEYPPGPKWRKYAAVYEPFLAKVKVIGTQAMIDEAKKPDSENKLKAILDVTTGGVGDPPALDKTYEGNIHFDVGKTGLKVTGDAPKKIQFKVVEVNPTP